VETFGCRRHAPFASDFQFALRREFHAVSNPFIRKLLYKAVLFADYSFWVQPVNDYTYDKYFYIAKISKSQLR
jgi:hypothetical protein